MAAGCLGELFVAFPHGDAGAPSDVGVAALDRGNAVDAPCTSGSCADAGRDASTPNDLVRPVDAGTDATVFEAGADVPADVPRDTPDVFVQRPGNDEWTAAELIPLSNPQELSLHRDVSGASLDPTHALPAACACPDGSTPGDVWFRVTFTEPTVLYVDTFGSTVPAVVGLAEDDGTWLAPDAALPQAGRCDTAHCDPDIAGVSWSRAYALVDARSYRIAVTMCSAGRLRLNVQRVGLLVTGELGGAPLVGTSTRPTFVGASSGWDASGLDVGDCGRFGTCGSGAVCDAGATSAWSGRTAQWFVTCGGPGTFSTCVTDGGRITSCDLDPVLAVYDAGQGAVRAGGCNDDAVGGCTNPAMSTCAGHAARLADVPLSRGLGAVLAYNYQASAGPQTFTLAHRLPTP